MSNVHAIHVRANNTNAERMLLGGCLREPELLDQFGDIPANAFYSTDHQALWELLQGMRRNGQVIDCATSVPEMVHHGGKSERFGGLGYVLELPDSVPSTANVRLYADTVLRLAAQRRLQASIGDWAEMAADPVTAPEVLGRVLVDIAKVRFPNAEKVDTNLSAVMKRAIDRADCLRLCGGTSAVPWPWEALQQITGGTMAGEVCIIAARPSIGKTAVAQTAARFIADRYVDGHVLVYNYEGTDEAIAFRHLLARARVNPYDLRTGNITADDINRLREVADVFANSGSGEMLHVIQANDMTIEKVEADVIQRQQDGQEIALVVIDYLQLVPPADRKLPREQQVASISAGCKRIATREGSTVAVWALSQLNRDLEKRSDKRPMLADLRESGSLEQDADTVIFVHREIEAADERSAAGPAELIVAKNRNGGTGTAELWFEKGQFRSQR